MKRRGFTLIELLAVIIILAVISLIAIPKVMNTIDNARKNTVKESANSIVKAAEIYWVKTSPRYGKVDITDNKLKYDGEVPEKGEIETNEDGLSRLYVYLDGYCATKEYDGEVYVSETTKDDCSWYATDNYETLTGSSIAINGRDIKNYKIYGNSEQKGTPAPTNPIPVTSLGETGKNLFNSDEQASTSIISPYYGIDIKNRYTENITISIKLKEGKAIPNCTFGFVYRQETSGGYSASWLLSQGNLLYNDRTLNTNIYNNWDKFGIGVYPATKEAWDSVLDSFDIQLEKGSTVTSYVPYNYVDVKVSGKNLFNKNNMESGSLNASTGVLEVSQNYTRSIDYIPVAPNKTYTWTITGNIRTHFYDINKNWLSSRSTTLENKTVMIPENCYFIKISKGTPLDTMQIYDIQLEEGSTATTYEPYQTPVTTTIDLTGHEPLRKVGDVADYIDYENSRIVRNIGVKTFDGSEGWNKEGYNFYIGFKNKYNAAQEFEYMSSHFTALKQTSNPNAGTFRGGAWTNNNTYNGNVLFNYNANSSTSVNDWASFLQNQNTAKNPVTMYYQKATPVYESITLPKLNNNLTNLIATDYSNIKASNIEVIVNK